MIATSKLVSSGTKPRYHSRLGVIVTKELGDIFKRSRIGWILLTLSLFLVPGILDVLSSGLYSGILDDYAHNPGPSDSVMRSSFPMLLGMLGIICLFIWLALLPLSNTNIMEPLLVTATRRWELVVGRLLAVELLWTAVGIAIVGELFAAPHISFMVSWCPFLSYFHPNVAFAAKLLLVWILGGSLLLIQGFYVGYPKKIRSVRGFSWLLSIAFIVAWEIPNAWPLIAFLPLTSMWGGIKAAFAQLPYDPRVHLHHHTSIGFDGYPHGWILCIVGSLIVTTIYCVLLAQSLPGSEIKFKSAKR